MLDPATLLSAIAVSTSTIALGPMVIALPRRRPWKVALHDDWITDLRPLVLAGPESSDF